MAAATRDRRVQQKHPALISQQARRWTLGTPFLGGTRGHAPASDVLAMELIVAHRSTRQTALPPACQTQLHMLAPRNTARRTIQPSPRSLVRSTACERGRTRHRFHCPYVCVFA